MILEHATYPRRREETLPEPSVLYLCREIFEDLRCSGERLARLAGLPAPLVEDSSDHHGRSAKKRRRSWLISSDIHLSRLA